MVELRSIPTSYIGSFIYEAFKGDWQLINTYHLVNGSLPDCVKSTFREIQKVSDAGNRLEYYGIYLDGQVIGFTVTGSNFLLSFGIAIQHRTRDIVLEWWRLVCRLFDGDFATWLYKKNIRAIEFVKRQGMEQVEDNELYVTLLFKKSVVCQQEVP